MIRPELLERYEVTATVVRDEDGGHLWHVLVVDRADNGTTYARSYPSSTMTGEEAMRDLLALVSGDSLD